MAESSAKPEEIFQPINADNEVTEIDSLCMNCQEQGVTKLLLTKIPFFKDVIVSSFECPHCHFKNSELSPAMEISVTGLEYILHVKDRVDMNRLVVKSEHSTVNVPELDLQIDPKTHKGEVTTVEGILNRVKIGLSQDQARRKEEHPELNEKIEEFLKKIDDCLDLKNKFTLNIRDVSGNSFIANRPDVLAIADDPNLTVKKFARTGADDELLGLTGTYTIEEEPVTDDSNVNFNEEVLKLPTDCPECGTPCLTKMKVTDIPLFKQVIIMATDCDKCGHRTNEVKPGGGCELLGKKVSLKVKTKEDFSRDVLKSDSCNISIPELELEAGSGTIVGKFTTIEGLLLDIKKQLSEENPLVGGDSVDPTMKEKMAKFCSDLDDLLSLKREFTIVLDDPAGNCWIQNIHDPAEDPEMKIEKYTRTFEQDEELGLNDLNVGDQ